MVLPGDVMKDWHDPLLLLGTASATLIGLLFVAASVAAGVFNRNRRPAVQTFLSPSLVQLTSVLTSCVVTVCPIRSWAVLGGLITCVGLFGLGYAGLVFRRMIRHGLFPRIDLEDRAWYTLSPMVGYTLVSTAGMAFMFRQPSACVWLAGGLGTLTLAAIRNAWDMTTWVALHRPDEPRSDEPGAAPPG